MHLSLERVVYLNEYYFICDFKFISKIKIHFNNSLVKLKLNQIFEFKYLIRTKGKE